jgi:formate dehydrogenase subunit gamma
VTSEDESRRSVACALHDLGRQPGSLLEILHAVQNALGHVPPEAVPLIADGLNLSHAEVHGVISFYHHFRREPAGRCVVQVCRAEACKSLHGEEIAAAARHKLGIDFGQTRADGGASLEAVYCLGNCACAPSLTVGGVLHGRCAPRDVGALIDAWVPA